MRKPITLRQVDNALCTRRRRLNAAGLYYMDRSTAWKSYDNGEQVADMLEQYHPSWVEDITNDSNHTPTLSGSSSDVRSDTAR